LRDIGPLFTVSLGVALALFAVAILPAPAAADGGGKFSLEPTYGQYTIDIASECSVNISVTIKNLQNIPDAADVYCFYSYLDDQRTFVAQTDRLGAGGEQDINFFIDLRSRIDAGTLLPINITVKRANDEEIQDTMIVIIRSLGFYGFDIMEPIAAAGQFDTGGYVNLPVTVMNTGNVNYAARLTLLVDGEQVSFATGQVSPGGETVMDVSWDSPTAGKHICTLKVQALLGYNNGDMDDPMLSEVLDECEFTVDIAEQGPPVNPIWLISGIVAVLLIIILIVAIKIKRNNG
jgi:hypothetical protein